jgi:hypothetical protein
MEIDVLALMCLHIIEYKITFNTSSIELYQKYITIVEDMISTFEINQPSFEEIACQ